MDKENLGVFSINELNILLKSSLESCNLELAYRIKVFMAKNNGPQIEKFLNYDIVRKNVLSLRSTNTLRMANIFTIKELLEHSTRQDLMKFKNMGYKSIREIITFLKDEFQFDIEGYWKDGVITFGVKTDG